MRHGFRGLALREGDPDDGLLHRFNAPLGQPQLVSNLIASATNWPSPIIAGVTSLPTPAARE
jgi:hypothetical protein